MRRRGRIDENQPGIVKALRKLGVGVLVLSPLGNGAPDLLCSYRGKYALFECKNPDKPKADQELTSAEREWIDAWPDEVYVIKTLDDALEVLL